MPPKKSKAKPVAKPKSKPSKSKQVREVHVLNGVNLNMLGLLDPELYGTATLREIETKVAQVAEQLKLGYKLRFFQTNSEAEYLEYIHELVVASANSNSIAGIIFNPSAWAHTSVALRDAVSMFSGVSLVEVHLHNIMEREEFRRFSFIEDIVDYRVMGMGPDGYLDALRWLASEIEKDRPELH